MKTLAELVIKEFITWGYRVVDKIDDVPLLCSKEGADYWVISDDVNIIDSQKQLFDKLADRSAQHINIEKNITLLLLVNISNLADTYDIVKIENNKAYFKKYILEYTDESLSELLSIIDAKGVNSVADLLMETEFFSHLKMEPKKMSAVNLLYSIAHKLPFIPVKSIVKERMFTGFHFSSPEMGSLLDWVMGAPENENELMKYISKPLESHV